MTRYAQLQRLAGTRALRLAVCGAVLAASLVFASGADAAEAVATPPGVGAGSMLQFALGLMLVLGLIVAAGWFMKRFSIGPSAAGLVKVIAGASVGQRERVVVVEVGDTWMVLGVAPGRVNALHTMPRGEVAISPSGAPGTPAAPTTMPESFAKWLKETMEKRRAK
jgi:flagellar protein FliO/FliZ